jgi:hypothetical protein
MTNGSENSGSVKRIPIGKFIMKHGRFMKVFLAFDKGYNFSAQT